MEILLNFWPIGAGGLVKSGSTVTLFHYFFYGTYPALSYPLPRKGEHALRNLGSGVGVWKVVVSYDYLLQAFRGAQEHIMWAEAECALLDDASMCVRLFR